MTEELDSKIKTEIFKIIEKDNLTTDEIQVLLNYKNDLKLEEKMKKMIEFSM